MANYGKLTELARLIRSGITASKLAASLEDEFGEKLVQVAMFKDIGKTGNFEVVLLNTGATLHSGQSGGGEVDTAEKVQAVIDQVGVWFDDQ